MTAHLAAAVGAAVFAGLLVRTLRPPRRPLVVRVGPYAELLRPRLGTGSPDVTWLRGSVGPPLPVGLVARLSRKMDNSTDESLELRLRQAGFSHIDAAHYRLRQVVRTLGGLAFGCVLGVVILRSFAGSVFLATCFGFPASTLQRNRLERAIANRRERMQAEVYTIAQLLAVHLRTGHGPVEAVRSVCRSGRGPVIEELRDGLSWMSSGIPPAECYQRLAEQTAAPSAARLYRLLGANAQSGGDIGRALLAVADDVRSERRDDVARRAVRRRTAMIAPLLLLIAPVMILFVGAAIPYLVLGYGRP